MPTWDHEDCDPAIDIEHTRLYRMMERLEPIIREGQQDTAVRRAIDILSRRMTEHFRIEEELFTTADWDSRTVMKEDHRRLLTMLKTLSEIPPADADARRSLFTSFLEALQRHDTDVDAPLFRMSH